MTYRLEIDSLKGIAILLVVLFHMNIVKTGYLGVDMFFVINGFLVVPSLIQKKSVSSFSYLDFLKKKYFRLAPLVTLFSLLSLIIAAIFFIPFTLLEWSTSAGVSSVFAQNLWEIHASKDYWSDSNGNSPFMHYWYLGVLFEFYIIYPILFLVIKNNKMKV